MGTAHGGGAASRAERAQRRSDPTVRQLDFAGTGSQNNDTVTPGALRTSPLELFEKFITPEMQQH